MIAISKIGHYLFNRRSQKGQWLFIIASLPFLAFALIGWQYGAFYFYAIPAVICIAQIIYPTMFGWLAIFSLYFVGTSIYIVLLAGDILKIIIKVRPKALLDFDDSIVFIFFVVVLIAVTFGLFKYRPKLIESI